MGRAATGDTRESASRMPAAGDLVTLSCLRTFGPVRGSARAEELKRSFGLLADEGAISIARGACVRPGPGKIILLTGPSGSGKSSALTNFAAQFRNLCLQQRRPLTTLSHVHESQFASDCSIIDQVAPHGGLADSVSALTACGLGEPRLWLRSFESLSEGEKFRARLALTISLQKSCFSAAQRPLEERQSGRRFAVLMCDEFCSGLHRRVAKAIAFNLRKLARRTGLCFVIATSADDLTADLDPDCVVRLSPAGGAVVTERTPLLRAVPTIRRTLRIEPGCKADYEQFAAMHYRAADELGFVDRVFVMRDEEAGEPIGIVVYAHPALELSLRNRATRGWFSRNPQRVNRHLRVLRRLVIHPDVRGCGLGHYLVRKTMPLVGTRFVECLAAMGEFNPVFERAGMFRVGQYDAPTGPRTAVAALQLMDIDPFSPELALHVARRPGVRAVIANAVADWYAATTVGGERRVERQTPEALVRAFRGLIGVRPVYYLWRRGLSVSPATLRGSLRERRPRRSF